MTLVLSNHDSVVQTNTILIAHFHWWLCWDFECGEALLLNFSFMPTLFVVSFIFTSLVGFWWHLCMLILLKLWLAGCWTQWQENWETLRVCYEEPIANPQGDVFDLRFLFFQLEDFLSIHFFSLNSFFDVSVKSLEFKIMRTFTMLWESGVFNC